MAKKILSDPIGWLLLLCTTVVVIFMLVVAGIWLVGTWGGGNGVSQRQAEHCFVGATYTC